MRKKIIPLLFLCVFLQTGFFFNSKPVQAQWLPYGGVVTATVVCTCTPSVWWIFVVLGRGGWALSYVSGSQAFLNYNMPFSRYVLGLYIPGVPSCWFYVGVTCVPIYQQGTITPISGSSRL